MQTVPLGFCHRYKNERRFCGLQNMPKSVFGRGSAPDVLVYCGGDIPPIPSPLGADPPLALAMRPLRSPARSTPDTVSVAAPGDTNPSDATDRKDKISTPNPRWTYGVRYLGRRTGSSFPIMASATGHWGSMILSLFGHWKTPLLNKKGVNSE